MNAPYRQLRSVGGFSLIELMVVILLISILATMAMPSMEGGMQRQRVQGALDQVLADVAYTRMLAVKDGVPAEIVFGEDGSYSLRRLPPSGSPEVVRTVALTRDFRGVGFDVVTGVGSLRFSSRGLLQNLSADGFVKVRNSGARDSVFVSPAGRLYRAR